MVEASQPFPVIPMSDASAPHDKSSRPANAGQFKTGNPGGPGRPRKVTADISRRLDEIAAEEAESIVRALVNKALEGDARAADLLLSRAWPKRRGRPIEVADFTMASPADCVAAAGGVAQATLRGELTAHEGQALGTVIDMQRRTIETAAMQDQVEALEAKVARYKADLK